MQTMTGQGGIGGVEGTVMMLNPSLRQQPSPVETVLSELLVEKKRLSKNLDLRVGKVHLCALSMQVP